VADSKARAAGTVYRDEAADLMAAAARGNARQAPPELELTARRAAPDVELDRRRPLPYPEPVGLNDNDDAIEAREDVRPAPRAQGRRLSVLQLVAWILIAPLYLLVAAGSVAVIALLVTRFVAA
jgi:hypothetical protein